MMQSYAMNVVETSFHFGTPWKQWEADFENRVLKNEKLKTLRFRLFTSKSLSNQPIRITKIFPEDHDQLFCVNIKTDNPFRP